MERGQGADVGDATTDGDTDADVLCEDVMEGETESVWVRVPVREGERVRVRLCDCDGNCDLLSDPDGVDVTEGVSEGDWLRVPEPLTDCDSDWDGVNVCEGVREVLRVTVDDRDRVRLLV